MMSDQQQPRGVHLNGSIPLANAEEVFHMTSSILGERLHRIPDGETGVRTYWIGWQIDVLARNAGLVVGLLRRSLTCCVSIAKWQRLSNMTQHHKQGRE